MTLNDQHKKAKTELIKLRDAIEKRAKGIDKAGIGSKEEIRSLYSQYNALNLVIKNHFDEHMTPLQIACNYGDRYERFNID